MHVPRFRFSARTSSLKTAVMGLGQRRVFRRRLRVSVRGPGAQNDRPVTIFRDCLQH